MSITRLFFATMLGLLFSGCASTRMDPAAMPSAAEVQALAPTGNLRVAFITGPLYATKDSGSGELKGVAVDLGRELARRVGRPFEPILYPSPAAVLAGGKSGEWDVALMGINAERAGAVKFTSPYMEVEQGYLVRAGVPIADATEVDKAGVRIAVAERTGVDLHLSRTLKNATLVRTKTVGDLEAVLASGNADAIAATKALLFDTAARHPGARVLEGRILVEPIGMCVPQGRDLTAAAYVGRFVEDAKAAGLVKSAIAAAGLRGVNVASAK